MLTPREAIRNGQVWLRPFGHFLPAEQGYMGFSSKTVCGNFFDEMEDGALVIIWIRVKNIEADWTGKFRGILQLKKVKGSADSFSSAKGNDLRKESDKDFSHAIQAVHAWEASPTNKISMKDIAPSIWPGKTQLIGHRSALMSHSELGNIEHLLVRQIGVYGQPSVPIRPFETVATSLV